MLFRSARFAALVGAEHRWEETAELENPAYLRNDLDRCYHCKTELFRLSHDLAARLGYGAIAYGYNASDRGDFRPGHRAAKENDIIAPLDERLVGRYTLDDITTLKALDRYRLILIEQPLEHDDIIGSPEGTVVESTAALRYLVTRLVKQDARGAKEEPSSTPPVDDEALWTPI